MCTYSLFSDISMYDFISMLLLKFPTLIVTYKKSIFKTKEVVNEIGQFSL